MKRFVILNEISKVVDQRHSLLYVKQKGPPPPLRYDRHRHAIVGA